MGRSHNVPPPITPAIGRPVSLTVGLLIGLLISGLALPALANPEAPEARIELEARIEWGQRYTVSAPIAGVVREVAIRAGDRVAAGDRLFALDTRRLEADAAAAEAEHRRLQLERAEADREVERAEELYDRTLIAARELELARIEQAMAAARLAGAQAAVQRIGIDRDDSRIHAPIGARVLSVAVTEGEAVSPALAPPVLATLGRMDPMRAQATVDAATAAGLQPGQTARVMLETGESIQGAIAAVGWELDDIGFGPGYRVEVEFAPPQDVHLRAGQRARILLDHSD